MVEELLCSRCEIVLVDDDLRRATDLVADCIGVLVEPAGGAGVAALLRYGDKLPGARAPVILTGAGARR